MPIEAIEIHETQITKLVKIKLAHPIVDGIWLGVGFILAPLIVVGIIYLIVSILIAMTLGA